MRAVSTRVVVATRGNSYLVLAELVDEWSSMRRSRSVRSSTSSEIFWWACHVDPLEKRQPAIRVMSEAPDHQGTSCPTPLISRSSPCWPTQGYTRAFAVGATFLFAAAIVALLMLKVGNEAVLEDAATNPGK